MAKKERRSKGPGGASGARNEDAAKQAAARRSRKSPSQKPVSPIALWMRANAPIVVIGVLSLLSVILFLARAEGDDNDGHDGHRTEDSDATGDGHLIPNINGIAVELSPEHGNKTLDFLHNFVCKYQPEAEIDTEIETVDVEGYCHPKLSAVPEHRTQQVSLAHNSPRDHGISAGELVMKLPRPLQIWDLDALRDKFIQQEFLGLAGKGDSETDETEPRSIARHKDTQNPLDSGAYLAVYLIRLLHGSRAGETSSDASNNEQCQNESDECTLTLVQRWDDVEQHKHRISKLSAYLNILPNVGDRLFKPGTTNHSPHGHPLFWSSRLLNKLYPRHTHAYDLIRHSQRMIESEFDALKQISDEFRENVNYLEYLTMRINVLSRAFGVPASRNDNGALWGTVDHINGPLLASEMLSYETSNFGSFLDEAVDDFKLRSMCPLLDMYNSHPNPNVSWRYDSKTSSYLIHAPKNSDVPPGHSIVVSYGKYTEGHLFAKYGYVNGDGSSPTEVSLAVFHRMLGDIGLGRQYSQLPFQLWDPKYRDEIFDDVLDEGSNMDPEMRKTLRSAKEALGVQAKELLRYLIFDDGYEECIDLTTSPDPIEKKLKVLKMQHLINIANDREAWTVRIPAKFPDARPLQSLPTSGNDSNKRNKKKNDAVAVNANRIISVCRLLSLRHDDAGGNAIGYLKEGLSTMAHSTSSSAKHFFHIEKHEDSLEYRAMMCVVRLCNAALSRYLGYDNDEPETVGSREWNAWYITTGEVRGLGIIQQTAGSEARRLKLEYKSSKGSMMDVAMTVREEGTCPLNFSLPLLDMIQ